MTGKQGRRSLVVFYPEYEQVRAFLRVMEGERKETFYSMRRIIEKYQGTPQSTTNWKDPDDWIPQRLPQGEERNLALHLWRESAGLINPRHVTPLWNFCHPRHHGLLKTNEEGLLYLSSRAKDFLDHSGGQVEQEIDAYEGVFFVLKLLSEHSPASIRDLRELFSAFCREQTSLAADEPISFALRGRINNLLARRMLQREGRLYAITEKGLTYLQAQGKHTGKRVTPSLQVQLRRLAKALSDQARKSLRQYIEGMDPYRFEHLVQRLLEEMGYTDVEVTSPSGDGGVDVIGEIELGVSRVREVIQVKRTHSSIGRPVLDRLRGSLHRFSAVRGTIITTGKFSRGAREAAFETGAAPITLIDGEKLLSLLIEYQIGIKRQRVEYLEFDRSLLETFDQEEKN